MIGPVTRMTRVAGVATVIHVVHAAVVHAGVVHILVVHVLVVHAPVARVLGVRAVIHGLAVALVSGVRHVPVRHVPVVHVRVVHVHVLVLIMVVLVVCVLPGILVRRSRRVRHRIVIFVGHADELIPIGGIGQGSSVLLLTTRFHGPRNLFPMTLPAVNRNARLAGYAATVTDSALVILSLASVLAGSLPLMIVWEVAAAAYMTAAYLATRRMTLRGTTDSRTGIFRWLSWLMPLAASLAGVNAALVSLVGRNLVAEGIDPGGLRVIGVAGIVIAWGLLNTSFVNVYMTFVDNAPDDRPPFRVPGEPKPDYPEMIYFSFLVGTSFAPSDVDVLTRPARRAVLVHGVVAFFFNAVVVAAAFQAVQQLA